MFQEGLWVVREVIKNHTREWVSPVGEKFGMMGTNCELFSCRHEQSCGKVQFGGTGKKVCIFAFRESLKNRTKSNTF